jgi:hypothetical protein
MNKTGHNIDISSYDAASNMNKTEKCETDTEKFSDGTILCGTLQKLCKNTVL